MMEPIAVTALQVVTFHAEWLEVVRKILHKHRCGLNVSQQRCIVLFPHGTMKSPLLPWDEEAFYYRLTLPDGAQFLEIRSAMGLSIFGFSASELEDEGPF